MKDSKVLKTIDIECTKSERRKLNFEAWRRGMTPEAYLRALVVAPNEMKPRRGIGEILVNAVGITIE